MGSSDMNDANQTWAMAILHVNMKTSTLNNIAVIFPKSGIANYI